MRYSILVLLLSFFIAGPLHALDHVIKIKISNGTHTDETVIRFHPNGSTGYDNGLDAAKLFSSNTLVPGLFTKAENNASLSINAFPVLTGMKVVPLFTRIGAPGNYSLTATILGAFDSGTKIFLHDLSNGQWFEFSNNTSLSFQLSQSSVNSAARFEIAFSLPAVISVINGTCGNPGVVTITKPMDSTWSCVIRDASGSLITSEDSILHSFNTTLQEGDYSYEIFNPASGIQSGTFQCSTTPATIADFDYSVFWTDSGATVTFMNESEHATSYQWNFGDGTSSTLSDPVHTFEYDSTYQVNLTGTDSNCVSSVTRSITLLNPITAITASENRNASLSVNATESGMQVIINNPNHKMMQLKVINVQGQLIHVQTTETSLKETFELPNGYYIVAAEGEEMHLSKSFSNIR